MSAPTYVVAPRRAGKTAAVEAWERLQHPTPTVEVPTSSQAGLAAVRVRLGGPTTG